MKRHYQTMRDIRFHNEEAGGTFFGQFERRFFNSRTLRSVFGKHGSIFISSEQFDPILAPEIPRKYTVRFIDQEGMIQSLSEFQQFETASAAKRYAKQIAELES